MVVEGLDMLELCGGERKGIVILRLSNVYRAVFCDFVAENGFAEGKNKLLFALIRDSPAILKFGDSWELDKNVDHNSF